jgi:hypothetical protein
MVNGPVGLTEADTFGISGSIGSGYSSAGKINAGTSLSLTLEPYENNLRQGMFKRLYL